MDKMKAQGRNFLIHTPIIVAKILYEYMCLWNEHLPGILRDYICMDLCL